MTDPNGSQDRDSADLPGLHATSTASYRCADLPTPALLQAIDEFNHQLFFEQHETLEDAWIEEQDSIRYFYQGILQIGVGFYHLRRGNYVGATALMRRGMDYLEPFSPVCMTIDVAGLLSETERARSEVVRLGPSQLQRFDPQLIPKVRLMSKDRGETGRG
jgi:uncharacterized protein